jgi:regulator of protease activity HflC (stomatin/prohibitin superfamily)
MKRSFEDVFTISLREKVDMRTSALMREIGRVAAARERRAKVIHADGEAQAAQKLAEAAKIISVSPAAMHLRFLQTLAKVSSENNSTVILPVPIDLLKAFLQKKERE